MKARNGIVMPLLAMVIGVGMIVSAGVIVSNRLHYENQVSGVSLSSTWANGTKTIGVQYGFTVSYTSPSGSPNAVIMFELNATGIVPADVSLEYNTGGGGWVAATFSQVDANTIRASTLTIVGGSGGGYDYHLTYNDMATFALEIWAETL
jgi:hypothetical protein